jgi:hypothetical protein
VKQRVEQWRQTRTKLGAMPAPLWAEAAAVARKVGVYRVARALGLNYLVLRSHAFPRTGVHGESRTRPRVTKQSAAGARATFVEVAGLKPVLAASEAVVVEVVAATGARLTLRLKDAALSSELAALVASFR